MAPLGSVDTLSLFSSPEVGIISLVVFLILCVTLLALCAKCHRNSSNAYDVSGSMTTNGAAGNGTTSKTTPADTTVSDDMTDGGLTYSSTWRDHKNMPPTTLERRPKAATD